MTDVARHLLVVFGVLLVMLSASAACIWLERRLLALWQDRYGPNRVGPFGLLQVLADMIKIFTKEDWIPPFADKPVFRPRAGDCHDHGAVVLCRGAVHAAHHGRAAEHRAAVLPGDVLDGRL